MMTGEEVLGFCLEYFANLDRSNAAIHTNKVRYSPITFGIAKMINASFDVGLCPTTTVDLLHDVIQHDNQYALDMGREAES